MKQKEVSAITEEQIENRIYYYLEEQKEHVIYKRKSDEYYNLFWNNVSLLQKKGILASSKNVEWFCNKLQLRGSYDKNKFFQGLSEMIFWLYSIRMNYDFEIDKKLHTKRENNNSDVDIQILKDGYKFNIEVKTPNQVIETDESVLRVIEPFRIFNSKEAQEQKLGKASSKFAQQIVRNSQGKYSGYEKGKKDDNKVIEYLKSGQTKFIYESNSINVLVLSVTSFQMNAYWGYLSNRFSGIFTEKFENKFLDKNNMKVKFSEFDKVDVIYLTNIVEGHTRYIKDYDSWKLENYCSIFLINPFSQRMENCSDVEVYRKLLEILPNDTLKFYKEYNEKNKRLAPVGIPIETIFLLEYLCKYYYPLHAV